MVTSKTYLFDVFVIKVRNAIFYCKKAYRYLIDENNIEAALNFLHRASAKIESADAIYWSNFDLLENIEYQKISQQMGVFIDEMIKNSAANHSHQWTSMEYNQLLNLIKDTPFE